MALKPLDPNMFEPEEAAVAAPAGPAPIDPAQFVAEEEDGELPSYANGLSPATPINKSPVDLEDRLRLSVGNDEGKAAFLKQKFGAVSRDEDGNFVVQKDGFWHRVDAKNFEDVDPWKVTKGLAKVAAAAGLGIGGLITGKSKEIIEGDEFAEEMVKDYADIAPETAAVGASIATGGAAAGLAGLTQVGVAGATAAGIASTRTSLGRAVGTYEATPEEQIRDIAFETGLNMLGTFIPLGVKPTGSWMAKKIPQLAKVYNSLSEGAQDAIKNTYGRLSAGAEAFDVMKQMPDELAGAMKTFGAASEGFEQAAQKDSIGWVQRVSKTARQTLNDMYEKMASRVVQAAPDNFVAPLTEPLKDVYEEATIAGLGTLAIPTGKGTWRVLNQTETIEQLAKGVPKGAKFSLKPASLMKEEMKASGNLSQYAALADDPKAHRMVVRAFKQLEDLSNAKPLAGKAGAKQMLELQKITNGITFDLKTQGKNMGNSVVQKFAANVNNRVKDRYTKLFDNMTEKSGSGRGLYTDLNDKYHRAKQALDTLVDASEGKANSKSAESFLGRLFTKGKKNVTEKEALNELERLTKEFDLPQGRLVQEVQKRLRVNEAAMAFNPVIKPGLLGQGSATAATGTAAAAAAGVASPAFVIPVATGAAISSPRLAYSLFRTKDFVSKLSAKQLEALRNNPELVTGLVQSAVQTPMIQEQVKNQLLGGGAK